MNNTFYFLRHGETRKDHSEPISRWLLSDRGMEQAKELVRKEVFNNVDLIFSSTEEKAIQTAKPIADTLRKKIYSLMKSASLIEIKTDSWNQKNTRKQ